MALPSIPGFALEAELGQGGMSVVYRARRLDDDRRVALKVLNEAIARQPDARARLLREAEATRRIDHPAAAAVLAVSPEDAERPYLVVELVEGETLRAFVERQGRVEPPELAALLVWRLADVLAHAHARGVIHRDLKPENVMITQEGELKLLDFGIAHVADAARLTLTGSLVGSPAHMAPEVIDGQRADAASDVFSLGTILFWLVTGALPFTAETASALFRRILAGDHPDPQELQPALGNGLRRVLEGMLATARAERLADGAAARDALAAELEAADVPRSAERLARYLVAPEAEAEAARDALARHLLAELDLAERQGNTARAIDRARRLRAIAPAHAERAQRTLQRRVTPRPRVSRATVAGAAAVGALVVAVVVRAASSGDGSGVEATGASASAVPGPPATPGAGNAPGSSAAPTVGAAPGASPVPSAGARPTSSPAPAPPAITAPAGAPSVDARPSDPDTVAVVTRPSPNPRPTQIPGAPPPASTRPNPSPSRSPSPFAARAPSASSSPAQSNPPVSLPAPARAAPEPTRAPEPPTPARRVALALRIGGSFADVRVDGLLAARNVYAHRLELEPGRHEITVEKPGFGRHAPVRVEVLADGRVLEVLREGAPRPITELGFLIPRAGDAAPLGWIPER
jgi:tRNA A-37 threonylcarbamoyl transferase component Bud32